MIVERPYQRERAVAYALRWALDRNPLFYDFVGIGGDCTNFVSQAVLAGSCVMNNTPTYGWYFRSLSDRSPSWTGVEYFYDFLTEAPEFASANGGIGPFGREVPARLATLGDVIQLADDTGDFYHTLIITAVTPDDFLVCAHTNDALNRPLSTYTYARARFLHIDGVRTEFPTAEPCFLNLLRGIALPQ